MRQLMCCLVICSGFLLHNSEDRVKNHMEDNLDYFNFTQVEGSAKEEGISFLDILDAVLSGDFQNIFSIVKKYCSGKLLAEIKQSKHLILELLSISLSAGIILQISRCFQNPGITLVSEYMIDMLFILVLFRGFMQCLAYAETYLASVETFMKAFLPAYSTALALTGKFTMAAAMGDFLLLFLILFLWIDRKILIPAIQIFLILSFFNHLMREKMFERLSELLSSGIDWAIKTMGAGLLGVQMLQNLVLPALDSQTQNLSLRVASLIPGIGDGVKAVVDTALASSILIKNGIGVAGMICIFVFTAFACAKMGIIYCCFSLASGLIQPIGDSVMVKMVSSGAEAVGKVAKLVLWCGILFFVTLGAVSYASGISVSR